MTVSYLTPAQIIAAKRTIIPPFHSASGYGRKIPTSFKIQLLDKIWRRVYVCQVSNAGTAYVLCKGQWRVINGEAENAIESLVA